MCFTWPQFGKPSYCCSHRNTGHALNPLRTREQLFRRGPPKRCCRLHLLDLCVSTALGLARELPPWPRAVHDARPSAMGIYQDSPWRQRFTTPPGAAPPTSFGSVPVAAATTGAGGESSCRSAGVAGKTLSHTSQHAVGPFTCANSGQNLARDFIPKRWHVVLHAP